MDQATAEAPGELILVRLSGDFGTKARPTAARFRARLARNLSDALATAGISARVWPTRSRIFLRAAGPGAAEAASRVFGVQSVSRALERPAPSVEAVCEAGERLFAEAVRGRRFAVRCRLVGERSHVPFQRRDVERDLGARLLPLSAGVDLERPEFTARIEIQGPRAYFFTDQLAGPGGLPIGVEGRAVALLSGGFDSAVAAWQLLRRGVALDFVFCNLGGTAHERDVLRVAHFLATHWCHGDRPRLHAVDFQPLAEALRARTERRYWQVLLKRSMLRAAEEVARERRALAIVTGEAVGQVSSQTLANLAVISRATELAILRPLAGSNKDEIVEAAKRIGTYDLSRHVAEYCALTTKRPATEARLEALLAEEAKLDPGLLPRLVAERAVLELHGLDPDARCAPDLEIDVMPEDATVLDLRSRAAFEAWHWPGALRVELASALEACAGFDPARRYVAVCEFGLKSALLAERMRQAGLRAQHWKGGSRALLRYAEERRVTEPALLAPAAREG